MGRKLEGYLYPTQRSPGRKLEGYLYPTVSPAIQRQEEELPPPDPRESSLKSRRLFWKYWAEIMRRAVSGEMAKKHKHQTKLLQEW